jgi:transcriptional regulator with XRE-family HTH domain
MTLHISDLIVIGILVVILVAAASGACYLFLLRRLRSLMAERQLKIAEQLGVLNEAIQALETRLAVHPPAASLNGLAQVEASAGSGQVSGSSVEGSEEPLPEIKAVIAAAAIAALGPNAEVKSIKAAGRPATSPWTQQGRVMVQGSHNLRVQR